MSAENPIAKYVLETVPHYDDLNAATAAESDEKFAEVLSSALGAAVAGVEVGRGGQFLINELANVPGIVVKRLRAGGMANQGEMPLEEYFKKLQEMHYFVQSYFGNFVPQTEFVSVEGNFGDPSPSYFEVPLGREFVMVQEEVHGEESAEYMVWDRSFDRPLPEALKDELREFVRCYRSMMRAGAVIEDQFMIDFENNHVAVVDTNHYYTLDFLVQNNPVFSVLPAVNETSSIPELIQAFANVSPKLTNLTSATYNELLDVLMYNTNTRDFVVDTIRGGLGISEFSPEYTGLIRLIDRILRFPPDGEQNNFFLRRLIHKFELGAV